MMASRKTFRMRMTARFVAVLCIATLLSARAQEPSAPPAGNARGANNQAGQGASPQDIQPLREEIRQLKALLKELRSQDKAIENHLTFAPEVEVQNEDYAQARLRFHTKLVRKGFSPQPW